LFKNYYVDGLKILIQKLKC